MSAITEALIELLASYKLLVRLRPCEALLSKEAQHLLRLCNMLEMVLAGTLAFHTRSTKHQVHQVLSTQSFAS